MEGDQVLNMNKLTVLGVGSAGCRIAGSLRNMPGAENLRLIAFDCDAEALERSGLSGDDVILAGKKWREGRGCGGQVDKGQAAAAAEREVLAEKLSDAKLLIVIAGLGRGFGSGAMAVIQSVTSRLKLPTLFLVTKPFVFEGVSRRNIAEKTITADLLPLAGAVITVPNDLLFSTRLPATVSHEEAFALADRVLAQSAMALAVTLSSGNRLAADYDTLSAVLNRKNAVCSIGHASVKADEPEWDRVLVERLLDAPMLGGSSKLKLADAAFMVLNGGEGLTLGDARTIFENLQKYTDRDCNVLVGAGADPAWGPETQLVVLTIKFESSGTPEAASGTAVSGSRKGRKRKVDSEDEFQPDLFAPQPGNLGIMEGTTPVNVDGVNLDVPTFLRKHIPIDGGN